MAGDGRGQPAQHQRALAADHHQPSRAGSAVHSAVSISGAARASVFCHENADAEAAAVDQRVDLERVLAEQRPRRRPNSTIAAASAADRDRTQPPRAVARARQRR